MEVMNLLSSKALEQSSNFGRDLPMITIAETPQLRAQRLGPTGFRVQELTYWWPVA